MVDQMRRRDFLGVAAAGAAAALQGGSIGSATDYSGTGLPWPFDRWHAAGGAGIRAFLKSIGSDEISPLFEKALTYSVAPAMATTTDALAAFVRWDLFRNSMLRFMENYDAILSPVAPFPALHHGASF